MCSTDGSHSCFLWSIICTTADQSPTVSIQRAGLLSYCHSQDIVAPLLANGAGDAASATNAAATTDADDRVHASDASGAAAARTDSDATNAANQ
jgi:hypothetical protein